MPTLFEPATINGMVVPNRFVRSATWEGLAEADGSPSQALVDLMAALAQGGVGLIISGHAFVAPEGRMGLRQLGAHNDDLVPALARMAATVRAAAATAAETVGAAGPGAAEAVGPAGRGGAAGAATSGTRGAKIALQITHAGLWAADAPGTEVPLGPSVRQTAAGPLGREMTLEDIAAVPPAFARAAARARAAGFDAVQIHAAHGYLLSSFMSPFCNKRDDAYGGDPVRRTRLVVEVVEAVRAAVGPDYPVLIKVNAADFVDGGLTEDDMLESAVLLERAGVDAIELSGGIALSGDYRPIRTGRAVSEGPEVYYEAASLRLKQKVKVPVMLVGGIRTLATAERLVAEGVADYVSLSRPLICEPGLIARWRSGDLRPAACRSCNRCYFKGFGGEVVRCVNRKAMTEAAAKTGSPEDR
jgi:2,4-dienoyl-CoA reductase-like NADH-dependent reductase (Old Yellow Enzyme family)